MVDLLDVMDQGYKYATIDSDGNADLSARGEVKVKGMMPSENVMVAYSVLCVAAAGVQQKAMEKAYDEYETTSNYYEKVCTYSQTAATKQQEAADNDECTYMSTTMRDWCDANGVGYSKAGNDRKHDSDEWQVVRDNLDYEKSIASTDMKMAGSEFDNVAKDFDSAQQMAVDGVKDNADLFSTLGRSI